MITPIIAKKGHVLTDGKDYVRVVYPADDGSAAIYHEITEEEYAEIMAKEKREAEERRNGY